jgi:hypothetical protein
MVHLPFAFRASARRAARVKRAGKRRLISATTVVVVVVWGGRGGGREFGAGKIRAGPTGVRYDAPDGALLS